MSEIKQVRFTHCDQPFPTSRAADALADVYCVRTEQSAIEDNLRAALALRGDTDQLNHMRDRRFMSEVASQLRKQRIGCRLAAIGSLYWGEFDQGVTYIEFREPLEGIECLPALFEIKQRHGHQPSQEEKNDLKLLLEDRLAGRTEGLNL